MPSSELSDFAVCRTYQTPGGSRAQVVSGLLEGREVQVHYVEPSGEFVLVDSGAQRVLSQRELRDLVGVMNRFEQYQPWVEGAAGNIMLGLNDALYPTAFAVYRVRSVSELGHLVLLTGRGTRGDIDVVYDTATRKVTVMETCTGHATVKRPLSARERTDLQAALERASRRPLRERTLALLGDVLRAIRAH